LCAGLQPIDLPPQLLRPLPPSLLVIWHEDLLEIRRVARDGTARSALPPLLRRRGAKVGDLLAQVLGPDALALGRGVDLGSPGHRRRTPALWRLAPRRGRHAVDGSSQPVGDLE